MTVEKELRTGKRNRAMIDTFADDKGFSSSLGGNARVVLPVAYKSTQHAQEESNRDILPMMPVILQCRHTYGRSGHSRLSS